MRFGIPHIEVILFLFSCASLVAPLTARPDAQAGARTLQEAADLNGRIKVYRTTSDANLLVPKKKRVKISGSPKSLQDLAEMSWNHERGFRPTP